MSSFASSEKVAWLERIDRETRTMDPRVKQVMASVVAVHEVVLVANSDGRLAADVRPLVRINVSVIVEQDGRREQGYAGAGGRITLPELVADDKPLRARARGRAPGAGQSGRRARACGPHDRGARARAGRASCCTKRSATASKATSTARARRHSRAASASAWRREVCTVVDDGTLSRRRGSLNIDDEGTPTQRTVLIENGVLQGLYAGHA